MRKRNALLVIDAQYDFCNPNGALYVDGADKDMERLGSWIKENKNEIDYIGLTLDSHQPIDIAHPSFWVDKDGNHPAPFTIIKLEDIENGTWTPRYFQSNVRQYIADLEEQGEFPHCIWPEHCIMGTTGAAIVDDIMDAVKEWSRTGGHMPWYNPITKGTNPLTEHFGAFTAQVPITGANETQLNQNLIKELSEYQNIYFAGEAKSHCVANTLKQAMKYAPNLAKKFIILTDCMSNVTGFENIADDIYEEAKNMGIRFSDTKTETLVSLSTNLA